MLRGQAFAGRKAESTSQNIEFILNPNQPQWQAKQIDAQRSEQNNAEAADGPRPNTKSAASPTLTLNNLNL